MGTCAAAGASSIAGACFEAGALEDDDDDHDAVGTAGGASNWT